jgi:hypothetical protein
MISFLYFINNKKVIVIVPAFKYSTQKYLYN